MKITLYFLTILCLNCNAQTSKFEYRIPNTYNGLCLVFISTAQNNIDENYVLINNQGLAIISEKNVYKYFIFKSTDAKSEIPIVQIGDEETAIDHKRYIFRNAKGNSRSSCDTAAIKLISFYVGNKQEYLEWSSKHQDDFEYFDSIGVDWCSYYKTHLK